MPQLRNNRIIRAVFFFFKTYFLNPKSKYGQYGDDIVLTPPIYFNNPANVFFKGKNIIGQFSNIQTKNAKLVFGYGSGAAEGLQVSTDNHMSFIGRMFRDVDESESDKYTDIGDVIIDEDVWIAKNVILLHSVHIGRGAIVGAGSVVRKNIPPYAIVIGNPAKVVGFRFTPNEIIEHEIQLYPIGERLQIEQLEKNYQKYFVNRLKEIRAYTRL